LHDESFVEREDSGVIDLFAIQKRASEAPPASNLLNAIPTPLASMPPPAFTTDLLNAPTSTPDLGDGPLDDDENPFANKGNGKKRVFYALAAAGAMLVVAIGIAAFSGGGTDDAAKTANASAAKAAVAPAPPPPVTPPVVTAQPAPPSNVPPPPTTGAVASKPPPATKAAARWNKAPAKKIASGPKLEKVTSAGVP